MEEAQRYSIVFKGLKNGHHEFRFAVDKSLFEEYESSEIKDGACEVVVDLDRGDTQLMLMVSISGYVVVACDRCLEDCRIPIDFAGELPVKFSDEVHEYDGEVIWLLPGEDRVDLKQYIYESIVLSLPYQRVHPDGECNPEMLERFRIISEGEFEALERKAASHEHDGGEWAKLAALRERMEADEEKTATKRDAAGDSKAPKE
ncbi:YceD family protein [Alistipes sp.]|uniref:YceD family protein n=1 Tax=Alistipes sp. TaxID=1872444 RepID=UPI003A83A85B